MSIVIKNLGPTCKAEADDSGGERNYEITINWKLIAKFTHHRRDSLAECLRRAADAVEASNDTV